MTLKPRKFADFRQPAIQRDPTPDEPIDKVVMRLFAGTSDGLRVLGWMLSETSKVTPPGVSEAMLREAEGARRFVASVHDMANGRYADRT